MAETGGRSAKAIASAAADDSPPLVALMHLLMAAGGDPSLAEALEKAAEDAPHGAGERERLARLAALLRTRPDAARIVAEVMAEADHAGAAGTGDVVERWAQIFDRLALSHPAASVALYSLGDEALLARATDEIVRWLERQGLLGPGRDVLDFGCGIGRIAHALGPSCRIVVGADVSAGMLFQAAARGGGGTPATFVRTGGRGLAAFSDAAFDLVLACDVFPYLMQAGGDLAMRHVVDMARVLRPGGDAVVFNLSYGRDEVLDRADADAWSARAGLVAAAEPERPFSLWDAMAWRWRKPA